MSLIWLGIFAVFVFLPIFGIGPYTKRGGRYAGNRLVWIILPPDEVTLEQHQHPTGRRGQEVADYWLRWFVWAVGTVGLNLIPDPVARDIAVVASLVFLLWTEVFDKFLDTVGHEVEIQIAETERATTQMPKTGEAVPYRMGEAERMRRFSPAFQEMTHDEVLRELHKRRRWAQFLRGVLHRPIHKPLLWK